MENDKWKTVYVCSLLTAHCSLLTAHCSLLTAHCSLLTAHCSLLTAHCLGLSLSRRPHRWQGASGPGPRSEAAVRAGQCQDHCHLPGSGVDVINRTGAEVRQSRQKRSGFVAS